MKSTEPDHTNKTTQERIMSAPTAAVSIVLAAEDLVSHWRRAFDTPPTLSDVADHMATLGVLIERLGVTVDSLPR